MHHPGENWFRLFTLKYTDEMRWKQEQKMESSRADGFVEEVRVGWFSLVKDVIAKYNLFGKLQQIFNIDQTGFSDETKDN